MSDLKTIDIATVLSEIVGKIADPQFVFFSGSYLSVAFEFQNRTKVKYPAVVWFEQPINKDFSNTNAIFIDSDITIYLLQASNYYKDSDTQRTETKQLLLNYEKLFCNELQKYHNISTIESFYDHDIKFIDDSGKSLFQDTQSGIRLKFNIKILKEYINNCK